MTEVYDALHGGGVPDGDVVRDEEEDVILRWTYRYESRHLLELEGFEPRAGTGDFAGSPPACALERIWVARRRARR